MTKIKSLCEKHYYSVFFFLFILVYSCIVPGGLRPWETIEVTRCFHAVNYSMGFCSRFLPGAIYNFIFGAVDETTLNLYLSVLMVVFFFVLSLFLERFILSVDREYRFVAMIVMLFFVTGPATFSIYIKVLGMLDVYWVFAALLFFILLSKKQTWIFLFVPFLLCVLTYFVTWICYIPFFILIILYKISITDTKKEKVYLWLSLFIAAAGAVIITLYFAVYEKGNLVYTVDEFIDIINSQGIKETAYYTESMYYNIDGTAYTGNIFKELLVRASINFIGFNAFTNIPLYLLVAPVVAFIYKFFIKQISVTSNKLKKFSYVCMMLLFVGTFVFSFAFSTDFVRWLGHAFLPLFTGFIYVLHNEGREAWEYVDVCINKSNIKKVITFLVFYALIVYDPYMT